MTRRGRKDVGASVRARLLRLAQASGEDFHLLLTRYVNERLLARLAASRHGARFILKGAALFTVWTGKPHRATRDVDLLGFGDSRVAHLRELFAEVFEWDVEDDGVRFEVASLDVGPIREAQEYSGVRAVAVARVAAARVRLQVDVGFGDAVTPEATEVDLPALLDFPAPRLRVYPRETVVSEKLEALVQLGLANTRMKDFYDLVVLSRLFGFKGQVLVRAIRATFQRRGTELPDTLPVGLTAAFAEDEQRRAQWSGFLRKAGVGDGGSLGEAVRAVARFAGEPLAAARHEAAYGAAWPPGGPWR